MQQWHCGRNWFATFLSSIDYRKGAMQKQRVTSKAIIELYREIWFWAVGPYEFVVQGFLGNRLCTDLPLPKTHSYCLSRLHDTSWGHSITWTRSRRQPIYVLQIFDKQYEGCRYQVGGISGPGQAFVRDKITINKVTLVRPSCIYTWGYAIRSIF